MKKTILLLLITLRVYSQHNLNIVKKDGSVLHVYSGAAISAFSGAKIYQKTGKPILASSIGFFIGSLAGASKELVYDKAMHRGCYSKPDALLTIWGSALGSLCLRIGIDIKQKKELDKENFQSLSK
ncbi:MAG: hypothetical protein JNJ40_18145 [Bacteroidia bacterium]|nr:hypothetical protein [Bacteroidia bacterium]